MTNYIFTKILGWRLEGAFDPAIKKSVVIVVPHTSWHDFYLGIFTRSIIKVPIDFIGKKELFRWPFGAYFRWMGGTPIDRSEGQNKVEAIAQIFSEKKEFRLSLAPEGTRKKVLNWKTGFYYISLAAEVPIIPVSFDYERKVVKIGQALYPTGDYEKDSRLLRLFFKGVKGKADL
ncbi:1-acyl-sn-glycerol-3-phosphate acyltransferase [Mesonia ostreae]|uniref:1-acyl-sn-glycerol-3-phosphate acyltransferase n=1 Tax=Mesonia ostreae TaxID=861110 RepID=A0ABU2KKG2_9FLAO|nr:1-acyl-sn-glycerol-3-phosphate acyltransferase [Mesonia ostreae]MDT0295198.1 1-acyl-sn-glycerol-3-phosphate acyltransferase [Mesonia ostreae]